MKEGVSIPGNAGGFITLIHIYCCIILLLVILKSYSTTIKWKTMQNGIYDMVPFV